MAGRITPYFKKDGPIFGHLFSMEPAAKRARGESVAVFNPSSLWELARSALVRVAPGDYDRSQSRRTYADGDVTLVANSRDDGAQWHEFRFESRGRNLTKITVNDSYRYIRDIYLPDMPFPEYARCEVEFYFRWDGAGLTYAIGDRALSTGVPASACARLEPFAPRRSAAGEADRKGYFVVDVDEATFYAHLDETTRELGRAPFLDGGVQTWFEDADRAGFPGYAAACMYKACAGASVA